MQALQSPLVFFRRIIFDVTEQHCQVAMEDEHHYFVLNLEHDGEVITSIHSVVRRAPWVICPQSVSRIQAFVGQPLRQRIAISLADIDSKQQCTHQYDLLMIALAQALHPGRHEYVTKVVGTRHEYRHAELWLNDDKLLDWHLSGTSIHSADEFDKKDLRSIMPWADKNLTDQKLQALFIQRRAIMVADSKGLNLDLIKNAGQIMASRSGACFAFQPERANQADRVIGSTRQDVKGPEDLLVKISQL